MNVSGSGVVGEAPAQGLPLLGAMSKTQALFSLLLASLVVPRLFKIISRLISPISRIPGPFVNKISSIPLMKASATGKTHELSAKLHARYGPIVVLSPHMISVTDKHEVKRIIQTEDWPKSEIFYGNFRQNPARPTLIAFTDKKAYAARKRFISGWFGLRYIRSLQPLMQQCIDVALATVDRACDAPGGELDIQHLCQGTAVDIIGTTIFGQTFDVVRTGSHPLPEYLKKMLKASGLLLFMPWIRRIPFRPTRPAYIDRFTLDIMESRRATARATPRRDLLQKLVEQLDGEDADGAFTPFDVQGEVTIMLTAGSETTANAELFTLLLLARHPAKLARLYEEVDAWYPPGELARPVDCEYSMAGMTYLQACEDEAMRLVPAQATGSPRESGRDEVVCGFRVPRGTTVFPSTQGVHHDERVWPDAGEFVPERWLEVYEKGKASEQFYWPFSAGSRVCIGKHFALQEMHLMLVSLFRRFEFEYVPGQQESTVFRVAQHMEAPKYVMKVRRRKF